jgi:hypothetical protein
MSFDVFPIFSCLIKGSLMIEEWYSSYYVFLSWFKKILTANKNEISYPPCLWFSFKTLASTFLCWHTFLNQLGKYRGAWFHMTWQYQSVFPSPAQFSIPQTSRPPSFPPSILSLCIKQQMMLICVFQIF